MKKVNYFKIIKVLIDEQKSISKDAYLLYIFLLNKNNSCFWGNHFSVSAKEIKRGVRTKTNRIVFRAIKEMEDIGLVKIIHKPKNHHENYIIYLEKCHEKIKSILSTGQDTSDLKSHQDVVTKKHGKDLGITKSHCYENLKSPLSPHYIYSIYKNNKNFKKEKIYKKEKNNDWGISVSCRSLTHQMGNAGLNKNQETDSSFLENSGNEEKKKKLRQKEKEVAQGYPFSEKVEIELTDLGREKPANDDICREILDHWNSKSIIHHKSPPDHKTRKIITNTIRHCGYGNITKAIDNYSNILSDKDFFFNYKWDLKTFLKRGSGENLLRFLPDGDMYESWQESKRIKQSQNSIKPIAKATSSGGIEYKPFDSNR